MFGLKFFSYIIIYHYRGENASINVSKKRHDLSVYVKFFEK